MNRRRFLKYAGATAAVVGASALGLDFLPRPQSNPTGNTASTTSSTSLTSSPTLASSTKTQLASLSGRLFFDYNGNGRQDDGPSVSGGRVQLRNGLGDVVAEARTDSSGAFRIEDVPVGDYTLFPVADLKFRYMCRSLDEFAAVTDGYAISLSEGMTELSVGLMEGFLTLPFPKGATIEHIIYVDLSFGKAYHDWMGNNPNYFKSFSCRGTVSNHLGTDFFVEEGSPVVAAAPGRVAVIYGSWPKQPATNWLAWADGNSLVIDHGSKGGLSFYTIYCHLKEVRNSLKEGQWVPRGYQLGSADNTGDFSECEHTHLHFQLDMNGVGWDRRIDPYRDLFNPASVPYWTKDNDPQYPAQ